MKSDQASNDIFKYLAAYPTLSLITQATHTTLSNNALLKHKQLTQIILSNPTPKTQLTMEALIPAEQLKALVDLLQEHLSEIFYVEQRIEDLNELFAAHYPEQTAKARHFLHFLTREKREVRARLDAAENKRMAVLDEIYKLSPGVTIIGSEGMGDNFYREQQRLSDPVIMEGWGMMRGVPNREDEDIGFWTSMWEFMEFSV